MVKMMKLKLLSSVLTIAIVLAMVPGLMLVTPSQDVLASSPPQLAVEIKAVVPSTTLSVCQYFHVDYEITNTAGDAAKNITVQGQIVAGSATISNPTNGFPELVVGAPP